MRVLPLLCALLLLGAACRQRGPRVYEVPKESGAPLAQGLPEGHPPVGLPSVGAPAGLPEGHPPAGGGMDMGSPEAAAAVPPPPAPGAGLTWSDPKGWTSKPAGSMRLASWDAGGADASVVALPGPAGGLLANVNRWRGQVGLGPWDEAAFGRESERVATPVGEAVVVGFEGGGKAIQGAVLSLDGTSWFFKVSGPKAAAEAARPGLLGLLRSLRKA